MTRHYKDYYKYAERMPFQVYISFLFGEIIFRQGVGPHLRKLKTFTDMPTPKSKKPLQAFLGIINYLGKFYSSNIKVCEPQR